MLGAHHAGSGSVPRRRRSGCRASRRAERELREQADETLARLELADVADRPAAGLPYGTLKRVELARALSTRPAAAAARRAGRRPQPRRGRRARRPLLALRDEFDLTILLVEHHMGMVMRDLRPRRRARLRAQDRRGHARRGAGGPAGDRGLPGSAGVSAARGRGPARPATGRSRCCTTSTSPSTRARSSRSSAPTAPGKTTTLRAISGIVARAAGAIDFDGADADRAARPSGSCGAGIAHVPEGRGTSPT